MVDPLEDGSRTPGSGGDVDVDDDSLDFVLQEYHTQRRPQDSTSDSVLETLTKDYGEMPPVLLWGPDNEDDGPMVQPEATAEMQALHRRYEIHGELARGGIGVIYKGRDADLGRDIAIKTLRDRHVANQEMVHRFVEEAQVGGQLQHPGIVPVYELGMREDRRPYFTMKLVKGQTLAALLEQREHPYDDLRRFLSIVEQVCQTVAYAHSRNVIHRDLKPANIMVGSFGEVQVMDWGLAKVLAAGGVADERKAKRGAEQTMIETVRNESNGTQSVTGSVMGTLAYMPPEQARGEVEQLDQRSDVFSLGAILFEVLTGRAPYVGEDVVEVREKAARADLHDAFVCLEESDVDPELEQIVKACLTPARKSRPRDAGVVAAQIGMYLSALEQRARSAELAAAEARVKAAGERRARRLTLALAVSVFLAVVLGGGGYLWMEEARRNRSRDLALKVDQALREAELSRGKAEASPLGDLRHWHRAIAAARRAQALAQAIEFDEGTLRRTNAFLARLQSRADQVGKDSRMATKVEELRLEWADNLPGRKKQRVAATLDAFREYGIDLLDLTPAKAATLISGSSIEPVLMDTLWSLAARLRRRRHEKIRLIEPQKIEQILDLMDRDPRHAKLRAAVFSRNLKELRAIAASSKTEEYAPRLLSRLAKALGKAGDSKLSLFLHRKAHRLSPKDYFVTHDLGAALQFSKPPRLDEAQCYFTALVSIRETWDAWHHLGNIHLAKRRFDEAIECYQKGLELDPRRVIMLGNLGRAYWSAGNLQRAGECFVKMTQIAPRELEPHILLGSFLFEKRDYAGAVKAYKDAVAVGPDSFKARFSLAWAYLRSKDPHAASPEYPEAIKLAIKLSGEDASSYLHLGLAYHQTNRVQDALDCFRKAVQLDPNLARAWQSLGVILSNHKGAYDPAIDAFERVLELRPKNHLAYFNLGVTYRKQGALDASIRALQEAIRIRADADTYHALGETFHQKGDLGGAYDAWSEAVRLAPKNPQYLHAFGLLCVVTGKSDQAMRAFLALLKRDRLQAMAWLRSALKHWQEALESGDKASRRSVIEMLEHWRRDETLAASLADLPEREHKICEGFWARVEALLEKEKGVK